MRRTFAMVVALALAAILHAQPAFRTSVDLVTVPVTVTAREQAWRRRRAWTGRLPDSRRRRAAGAVARQPRAAPAQPVHPARFEPEHGVGSPDAGDSHRRHAARSARARRRSGAAVLCVEGPGSVSVDATPRAQAGVVDRVAAVARHRAHRRDERRRCGWSSRPAIRCP